jgi:hypothetical protein
MGLLDDIGGPEFTEKMVNGIKEMERRPTAFAETFSTSTTKPEPTQFERDCWSLVKAKPEPRRAVKEPVCGWDPYDLG